MPNRLIEATSPYLLQHAHNPVDWHPWGPEALNLARELDLPIFLSVGYSACHWCHVMERESFENADVAAFLNKHFVPIKVDREERPDLDELYMGAVQLLAGRGGWPMSVWLTPELEPFYGGTYFPPVSRGGCQASWMSWRGWPGSGRNAARMCLPKPGSWWRPFGRGAESGATPLARGFLRWRSVICPIPSMLDGVVSGVPPSSLPSRL